MRPATGHRPSRRALALLLGLSMLMLAAVPLLHTLQHQGHHHRPEDCFVCQQLHYVKRLVQALMPLLATLLLLHLLHARAPGPGGRRLYLLPRTPVALKVKMTD
ncbi:MAG: hypothetical protein GX650_04885 [Clostridiales bacterium]|jgi:hypothetical protein|nr:hypothetical protein [Clostridiales bacterium]